MAQWFTSDWHLGHHNIIESCKRPFHDVAQMNETLVKNYNDLVSDNDQVYFLGDVAFCDPRPYIARLKGNKMLIVGNHDQSRLSDHKRCGWGWIKDVFELKTDLNKIWLSHYAHRTWPSAHYGAWHLFGHSHGGMPATETSLDVGVDCWNYRPVSLDQIAEKLVHPKDRKAS